MNSLKECAELFERLGLTELFVKDGEQELRLTKQYAVPAPAVMPAPVFTAPEPAIAEPSKEPAGEPVKAAETPAGEMIKAPLLGIFHGRTQEGAVKIGDAVKKGETLCAIEAMKMMNEVTAPRDGVIADILASEGALVEYGQSLFVLA
ncbi:MAG: acetyl-CoA carboxylase, biotin carboxyl carrier protein [Lachnospiraceae bacterium]|nr:acetyl-CoA carboxylase, biotin carboxyl carrier protein [Lachnospiraceae bacterium]